jgi:hypothetical protein
VLDDWVTKFKEKYPQVGVIERMKVVAEDKKK